MQVGHVFHECYALCDGYLLQSIPRGPRLKFQRLESLVCLDRPIEAFHSGIPHSRWLIAA